MDLGGVLLAILLLQPKELVAVLALALESGRKLGIEILALDVLPMNTGLIKSRRSASPSTRRPEVSTSSSCLAVAARLRDRTVSSNSVDKRRYFSRMSAVGVLGLHKESVKRSVKCQETVTGSDKSLFLHLCIKRVRCKGH